MGPARFHCATLLHMQYTAVIYEYRCGVTTVLVLHLQGYHIGTTKIFTTTGLETEIV